ncbi:hypothetical protein ACFL1U_02220 [Patescibacteria group bacterium]
MSTFAAGLLNQLGDALENADYSAGDVNKLRSDHDLLMKIKAVQKGVAEIVFIKHVIDLDADPFVPEGWTYDRHIAQGQFEWDPTRIELFQSEEQKQRMISPQSVRKALRGMPVLNANLLDYLLAHPELYPEVWGDMQVIFWGTVYCSPNGGFYVRYVRRWMGKLETEYIHVDSPLVNACAAIFASK